MWYTFKMCLQIVPLIDNSPWTQPSLTAWKTSRVWQKCYCGTSKSASSKPRGFRLGSLQCSHWSPKSLGVKFHHLEATILWRRPSQPAWLDQRQGSETGYREIGTWVWAPTCQPSTVRAPSTVWWYPSGQPRGSQPSWACLNSCPLEAVMIVVRQSRLGTASYTAIFNWYRRKGKVFNMNPNCCT